MANWSILKAAIANVIKTNGNQAITGQVLQNTLNSIVNSIGENYQFVDIATPATNPGAPDGNVFYIAYTAGAYVNFNNITVNSNEVVFLLYKGRWSKKIIGLATAEELDALNASLTKAKTNIFYATCTTAANAVTKIVAMANFDLSINTRFVIKMTNSNTAANPTLNVNKTGAKPIYYNGAAASADNAWKNGETLDVYYDGTNYQTYNIQGSTNGGNLPLYLDFDTEIGTYNGAGGLASNPKAIRLELQNLGVMCHAYVLGDIKPTHCKVLIQDKSGIYAEYPSQDNEIELDFLKYGKNVKVVFYFEENVIDPPKIRVDIYGEYIMPEFEIKASDYTFIPKTAYISGPTNNAILQDGNSKSIVVSENASTFTTEENIELPFQPSVISYEILPTKYELGLAFLFIYESGSPMVRWGYYYSNGSMFIPKGARYMKMMVTVKNNQPFPDINPADVFKSVKFRYKTGLATESLSKRLSDLKETKVDTLIKLRVLSWNIGHFSLGSRENSTITDSDVEQKRKQYRECFNRISADIVCLCEFDNVFNTSTNSTPDEEILSCYSYKSVGPKYGYNMNAVFSRIPIVSSRRYDFNSMGQHRYVQEVTYNIGGNEIIVVATHLDWDTKEHLTSQINQLISTYKNSPYVIIGADFNSTEELGGAELFNAFVENGYTLLNHGYMGNIKTYPTGKENSVLESSLDNIVVKGFSMGAISSEENIGLSDHCLVYCDLYLI